MGCRLLILWLRFGALEFHFDVFLWAWGRTLDPFFGFLRKVSKKDQQRSEKGVKIDAFPMIFKVFPENAKVRFDCAGASGLRFRPLIFWLCASIFALLFLHSFFTVFGPPRGPQFQGSAAQPAPLNHV